MATKYSGTRIRSSRNRATAAFRPASAPHPTQADALEALEKAIEEERGRLMKAESTLHCVVIAMDEADCHKVHGPYYQNVIGVARDLVIQAINQLDSIRMRPMLERLAPQGKHEVKEIAAVYVH